MKKFLIAVILTFGLFSYSFVMSSPGSSADLSSEVGNYQGKWWINVGPIIGDSHSTSSNVYAASGFGINTSINIMPFQHQLLTLSTTSEGLIAAVPFFGLITDSDSTSDASLLYGLIGKNHYGYISFSTGISRVKFRDKSEFIFGNYNHTIKHSAVSIGLPFQSQIFWTPCRYFGLGIIGFANVNHIKNYYGGGLEIQTGVLR